MKKILIALIAVLLSNTAFSHYDDNCCGKNESDKRAILVRLITESVEQQARYNLFPSEDEFEVLRNLETTDTKSLERLFKAIEERTPDDGDE